MIYIHTHIYSILIIFLFIYNHSLLVFNILSILFVIFLRRLNAFYFLFIFYCLVFISFCKIYFIYSNDFPAYDIFYSYILSSLSSSVLPKNYVCYFIIFLTFSSQSIRKLSLKKFYIRFYLS